MKKTSPAISALITKVNAYKHVIQRMSKGYTGLPEQEITYIRVKQKCLDSLLDIVSVMRAEGIVSTACTSLSELLSASSPEKLDRNTLNTALSLCVLLKKDIALRHISTKSPKSSSSRLQLQSFALKQLLGINESAFRARNTGENGIFLNEYMYRNMNIIQINAVLEEIHRLELLFFSSEGYAAYTIPHRFERFLRNLRQLFERKRALFGVSAAPVVEKRKLDDPSSSDFDTSYRRMKVAFLTGEYLKSKEICTDLIKRFADHPQISEVCMMQEKIIAELNKKDSEIPPAVAPAPIIIKKVDPKLIDPKTGKIMDDFG